MVCTLMGETGPVKQNAIRRFWWLWVGLFLLGILLVRIVAAIGKRRRLAIETSVRTGRARAIKDAWAEAGKRAEPLPEGEVGEHDEDDA